MFEQYKNELTALVYEGDFIREATRYEKDQSPYLFFKVAKLTPNPELENHEVTITFMSETKVKI